MKKLQKLGIKYAKEIPKVLFKKYKEIRNYREYLKLLEKKLPAYLYTKLGMRCEGTYQNKIAPQELFAFLFPTHKNLCPSCGTETKWDPGLRKYREHCSKRCMEKDPEIVARRNATCLARFGTENPNELSSIKKKVKSTFKKKYGVVNVSQNEEIKQLKKDTSLENCGETHWLKTKEGRQQFSDNNPMYHESSKKKIRKTRLEKYGTENMAHNNYCYTSHIDSKGKEHRIQGYEGLCIDWSILNIRNLSSIRSLMKQKGIRYTYESTRCRYYPDLLIKRTDLKSIVIEVKSQYTLIKELNKNYAKFKAAEVYYKKRNKLFWLWLKNKQGIHVIKKPSMYVALLLESHKQLLDSLRINSDRKKVTKDGL